MSNSIVRGIQIPQILLPKAGIDLRKWAVIACDQFTSEPDYWQQVKDFIGEAPSTYNLILPEVFLGSHDETVSIRKIKQSMQAYLENGLLDRHDGPIYVERTIDQRTRKGIMLCLDLDEYDYNAGSQTLIRATEGTILERLPPRMRIREGARLELPHIIVLIDDPQYSVIEPLGAIKDKLPELYNFDLMADSGHLAGYSVADPNLVDGILRALNSLADPHSFQTRYGVGPEKNLLLLAIGDGNHSLAAAKAVWEKMRPQVGPNHPSRYALVEIENLRDPGLDFKPIHRVLFGVKVDGLWTMEVFYRGQIKSWRCATLQSMIESVNQQDGNKHLIGIISSQGWHVVEVSIPRSNLPVGTLQPFLDDLLRLGDAAKIDYVHGEDVVCRLGSEPGNLGFYLPAMQKSDLFKTVILDGTLPRKTFSMGEAREKRFYQECRQIS